ncbi:MAG: ACT domain-containing protein [Acholeplasmataceae bacterium]|nr:ACT domain-containing protein [Acholeplasmataceae bacterium]
MTKTIAVLGPEGTFSDLAAKMITKDDDHIIYRDTIEDVLKTVGTQATHALVPIENALDGFIYRTLDGIYEHTLSIHADIKISIDYALVGLIGCPEDIQRIFVQFAAKAQTQSFLNTLGNVSVIVTESNMVSHHHILSQGDAAIVPRHISTPDFPYRKTLSDPNVLNETRFVLLSRRVHQIPEGPLKVSVIVKPESDRPGLLYDILSVFKTHDINLVSIMSRPMKTTMGRYIFFLEMEGTLQNRQEIEIALKTISASATVTVLGYYGSITL